MTSNIPPTTHSPAQDYTFRVPSPPRVIVPPPRLNDDGIPNLQLGGNENEDYESSGFSNADFLSIVAHHDLITKNNMLEWNYEQRRAAQRILPFLYLGPMTAAKDKDFLITEGITMVLSVRNIQSAQAKLLGSRVAHELGLEVQSIDVNGNQELIAAFPRGIEVVNAHLSRRHQHLQARSSHIQTPSNRQTNSVPGKVLVFCETGNDRSAPMVAAYIMAMYSKDLCTTLQLVQAQRFCIAFDDSLRSLLQTYEMILVAKRDVHRSLGAEVPVWHSANDSSGKSVHLVAPAGKSTKRSFDEAHNDDMDVDMDGDQQEPDAERFEARNGLAPFLD